MTTPPEPLPCGLAWPVRLLPGDELRTALQAVVADIVRHLAGRDSGSYPEGRDWDFYRAIALDTPDDQAYPLL